MYPANPAHREADCCIRAQMQTRAGCKQIVRQPPRHQSSLESCSTPKPKDALSVICVLLSGCVARLLLPRRPALTSFVQDGRSQKRIKGNVKKLGRKDYRRLRRVWRSLREERGAQQKPVPSRTERPFEKPSQRSGI